MTVQQFKSENGYEVDGRWLPRVTSITSFSAGRMLFAKNASLGLSSTEMFSRAADWGSMVHEAAARVLKGEMFQLDPKIAPSIRALQGWMEEYGVVVPYPEQDIESLVVNREHWYAGTFDFCARVNGRMGIVDLKTGSGIRKEHRLQTAAYLHAYRGVEGADLQCNARWILRIDQYAECALCAMKMREKYAVSIVSSITCVHEWLPPKAEVEFRELQEYEKDFGDFLGAKTRWEMHHRGTLRDIPLYPLR